MSKLSALLLIVSAGAQTLTTVTQSVVNPDGTLASGSAKIELSGACQSGSVFVGEKIITSEFTAGAFSVQLASNTGACAGTSYAVAWQLTGGPSWTESWIVPSSGSPVSIASVRTSSTSLGGPSWTRGSYAINVTQPLLSDSGLFQYFDAYPYNISSVSCSTDTGTATLNLDIRTVAAPNTAGSSVLASSLVCAATATASSTPSTPVLIGTGYLVALDLSALTGAPNVIRVFVQKSPQ